MGDNANRFGIIVSYRSTVVPSITHKFIGTGELQIYLVKLRFSKNIITKSV